MGLTATFDVEEYGYPTTLWAEVGDIQIEVEVDYSEALEAFCETFESVSSSLVPVDTGYLQDSIGYEYDETSATVYAEAEYAQFVEYGTWKMAAQPYFTPAVEEAWDEFTSLAMDALEEAQEELEEQAEEAAEELAEEMEDEEGALANFFATLFIAIITAMFNEIFSDVGIHFPGVSVSHIVSSLPSIDIT